MLLNSQFWLFNLGGGKSLEGARMCLPDYSDIVSSGVQESWITHCLPCHSNQPIVGTSSLKRCIWLILRVMEEVHAVLW